MITDLAKFENRFADKQAQLERAKRILKTEFIGIDSIIDNLIGNIGAWYSFNELQDKPLVINLWGLTGVGKTSLLNRIVELLEFKDYYFRFDMGKKRGMFSFNSALDDLCDNKDASPVIIALDEFQHARTIEGPFRTEVGDENSRMVWELIDSGEVQYVKWNNGTWSFYDYILKLSLLLNVGVKVQNGYVVENKKLFCKELELDCSDEKVLFVNQKWYENIIDYANGKLGNLLLKDVEALLLKMNGKETISFLNKVLRIAKRPAIKKFTNALIIILGNLDEAYTMGGDYSVDIDADEFHHQSLKINITMIKKALRNRFRDEQIARLGNIHIIYPALDKKSYQEIIKLELKRLSQKLIKTLGLSIEFDSSVNKVIYSEGVYPTQGARPVFTTINQMIKSNIPFFVTEIFANKTQITSLSFNIESDKLICNYYHGEIKVMTKEMTIALELKEIRKPKRDDMQAITAIHESGHAVIAYVLLDLIPEAIFSVTSDSDISGFVHTRMEKGFISRSQIIPNIAMMLGGYMAEELIFGKDNITSGAESDIERATIFLSKMYSSSGMGDLPLRYAIPTTATMNYLHLSNNEIEEKIKQSTKLALYIAKQTLIQEKGLLLKMAEYLSEFPKLEKQAIKELIDKYSIHSKARSNSNFDYQKHLKQCVKHQFGITAIAESTTLIMNKDVSKL
jgi:cell division protease FtsH